MSQLFALILLAFVVTPQALAAPAYEDAWEFFGRPDGRAVMSTEQYDDALRSLAVQFDYICGDTFCEGDYANLSSLGIDCSIDATSRKVGQCVWTLAGSYAEVDPRTGRIRVSRKVFVCDLALVGDAAALAGFLTRAAVAGPTGYQGLRDELIPGSGKDLMETITDCL